MPLAFPPRRCAELCAPAGDLVALDRGDHRLFEQHPRRAHRPGAAGVVAAGADRAEIETRAEMARTSGQDGDPRVPVFSESRDGFAPRDCGEGIDRMSLFGAADRPARERAILRPIDSLRAPPDL